MTTDTTQARDRDEQLWQTAKAILAERRHDGRATAADVVIIDAIMTPVLAEVRRLREELGWASAARDKARAALGVIFDDAELLITPVIAAHVLAHFGRGGYGAGSFAADLIMLIARADPDNRARLLCPFPGYVAAVNLAQNTTAGIGRLAEIAALEVPDADA